MRNPVRLVRPALVSLVLWSFAATADDAAAAATVDKSVPVDSNEVDESVDVDEGSSVDENNAAADESVPTDENTTVDGKSAADDDVSAGAHDAVDDAEKAPSADVVKVVVDVSIDLSESDADEKVDDGGFTIPGISEPLTGGAVVVKPYVAYRPRAELIGDRTLTTNDLGTQITHRARLGVLAEVGSLAYARVEFQDVRLWGSEFSNPGRPPDPTAFGVVNGSVDLHQGYAGIKFSPYVDLRVGRQEINIDNLRVVGALDWAQTARSFDSIRLLGDVGDALSYTAAAAVITDLEANTGLGDAWLALAAVDFKMIPNHKLHAAVFYDGNLQIERQRGTGGFHWTGKLGGFAYEAEGYAQGSLHPDGVRYAILAALRGGYTFDTVLHPGFGFLVDILSGSPGGEGKPGLTTFDPFYGLNHAFYGYQDFFTVLPLHTNNLGLIDVSPKVTLGEGTLSARAYVHVFAPTSYIGTGIPMYGVEPDVVVSWQALKQVKIEGGASAFIPVGDALGRGDRIVPWMYLQMATQLGG